MAEHFKSVDAYIASFPKETQDVLRILRKIIHEEIEDVEETIKYNMPTFNKNGSYVIYFALWKKHISLYPFTEEMADAFEETKQYNTSGKGTIQFPLDQSLPIPLIKKIIQMRLKEL